MTLDPTPATVAALAHVTTPSGAVCAIPDGTRLVFGRGPDADLVIPAGRGLSRRAGVISAVAGGAWVANISRTTPCTPRVTATASGCPGWTRPGKRAAALSRPRAGSCGTAPRWSGRAPCSTRACRSAWSWPRPGAARRTLARLLQPSRADGDVTLLPFYLDPNTKLFLVALLWCRPWLSIRLAAARCPGRRRSRARRSR